MPFNSIEYFAFLWAAALVFHAAPPAFKKPLLLALCYFFYGMWSPWFLLFLVSATVVAFFLARHRYPAIGLILLLGAFVFFKGLPLWRLPFSFLTHIAVPAGFSYYTFRLLGYVIDVSWEKIPAEKDFVSFAGFVAFFPHILCGPIMRAEEYFPQSPNLFRQDPALWASGLRLILFGLFKKLVIADNLAVVVNNVFEHSRMYNPVALWVAAYAFYVQLYADFSGLTNIAIGSGRLFGVDAPPNFNAPYLARNIQDFWRRWHMTLCRWINDYLFLPLRMGLRNLGAAGLILSLYLGMLAISLWHGFSSGFIAFGVIQGSLMTLSVLTMKFRDRFFKKYGNLAPLRRVFGPLITFHLLVFSFIFFRCASFGEGIEFISRLFRGPYQFSVLGMGLGKSTIAGIVLAFAAVEWLERAQSREGSFGFARRPVLLRWGAYYATLAGILFFGHLWPTEFIYFKF